MSKEMSNGSDVLFSWRVFPLVYDLGTKEKPFDIKTTFILIVLRIQQGNRVGLVLYVITKASLVL